MAQWVTVVLLSAVWSVSSESRFESTTTRSPRQKLIDDILRGYDPRIPPSTHNDGPVEVTIQLFFNSIDKISETEMEYSISVFLRQSWYDNRLIYTPQPSVHVLELDVKLMDQIWVPDLFLANEKRGNFHTVTVPNKLMHIYPNGRVQYSMRLSEVLKCNMDLRKFPLDTQHCPVVMESYGYSTDNLVFQWHTDGILRDGTLKMSQYSLGDITTGRCDKQYVGVNYTCLFADVELIRSFGYYLTQVYIPSILIVTLSWVSFWLDIDAVPARISLGLLTVLTMTTQSSGARAALPRVSYVKGIDIWMTMCLVCVFLALIEFAYINVLSRVEKRRQETVKGGLKQLHNIKQGDEENGEVETKRILGRRRTFTFLSPDRQKARTLDKISRVVFPLVFIVFNIIYWSVYIFWEPQGEVDQY